MLGLRIRFHCIYVGLGQTKTSGCLGDRRKHRDWSSSGHGSRQKWSQSGNHCKVSRPKWISDSRIKYFRRGELLDKVKDQCIAKGGSASQVESLEIFVAPSIFSHFYVATLTFQILVLPLDLCNYAGHKAAFDKVVSSNWTFCQHLSSSCNLRVVDFQLHGGLDFYSAYDCCFLFCFVL